MIRDYFNSKAAIWDEKIAEKDNVKLEKMARSLNIEPGSTVLDVGTGTGVFAPFLLDRIGKNGRLVCMDFAEEMLKRARAKNFEGNIDYVCADITKTKFDDEFFHTVVCYSSFPHFHDKVKALLEIRRVLKKGGNLLICHTSSRSEINQIHQQISAVCNHLIPDEKEMRGLLSSAGFEGITILDEKNSYLAKAIKLS